MRKLVFVFLLHFTSESHYDSVKKEKRKKNAIYHEAAIIALKRKIENKILKYVSICEIMYDNLKRGEMISLRYI